MNNKRPIFYILAGIYLLYIDYSLIKGWASLENKALFVVFIIFFGITGGGIVIYSAWKMLKDRRAEDNNHQLPQSNDDNHEEGTDEESGDQ